MERTDLGRIVAFTDGVMAVAITLLVLNFDVPELPSGREDELGEALVDLLPTFLAYVLSFALVGRFWVVHHNLFQRLRSFDGLLMALNLVFLALIALVPFATDLLDSYTKQPLAAAVFGGTLGLAALANWLMHRHILRAELVKEHHRQAASDSAGAMAFGLTAAFLLSVPLAFVSVYIAQALWLSTVLVLYPLRRLGRRTTSA
jgi:uncharacterized membrane protein